MSYDKVSYLLEEITFEPFRAEVSFQIPRTNKGFIVDAHIAIQTRLDSPPKHVATISPNAPNNVRLYLDRIDITPFYVRELTDTLNTIDQTALAEAYSIAMSSFIDYAESMGNAYDGLIADLRKEAARLSAVRPLGNLVSQIGNNSHGHHGHLHICNFLYGQIPVPEISLSKVISLYNKANPGTPLSAANIGRFTFASGPSFFLDLKEWKKNPPAAIGAIALTIALQIHDPIEDEISHLKQQMQEMQDEITDALENIKESLSTNGPIRRTVARIEATSDKALLEMHSARRDLQSCETQLNAQAQTLAQIKTQVDGL